MAEVKEMRLFQMRYRKGMLSPCFGFIEASSLQKAEEIAKEYCLKHADHKFIGIEDPILAREETQPVAAEKKDKKSA